MSETKLKSPVTDEMVKHRFRLLLVALGAFVVVGVGAEVVGGMNRTEPYTELGDRAQRCIDNKGDGEWYGSMGISLQKFCEGAAALQDLEEDRKTHPENY